MVCLNPFLAVSGTQELQKIAHELARVVGDMTSWIFADDEHLTDVGLGLDVAFKTVFITTLFFADLAEPAKALETF